MGKVAKLLIIDDKDKYLMMYRSAHPVFGNDPEDFLEKAKSANDTYMYMVYGELT